MGKRTSAQDAPRSTQSATSFVYKNYTKVSDVDLIKLTCTKILNM